MKHSTFRTALLAFSGAALLTAVLSGPLFAADTLKLGVAGPHSGDLASYGLPTVKAAELVAKEINAKGGILGRQVELLVEDDVCKPEVATNTATKLVSQKVDVVIGHICSGATKAALGIYKDAKVIAISPSATNPDLTQSGQYPNFYRTVASDDAQVLLEVNFAIGKLKVKKIAVLYDKRDYDKGLAEYAKKFIEESKKATVVLFEGITRRPEDQTVRSRGGDFRRLPSGGLFHRLPDAQEGHENPFHLR